MEHGQQRVSIPVSQLDAKARSRDAASSVLTQSMWKGVDFEKVSATIVVALIVAFGHLPQHQSAYAQSNVGESEPFPPPTRLTSPTSPSVSVDNDAYLLGVGDRLRVDVFNIPDYGGDFPILSGGNINLPVVGTVPVEGLSLRQASARIEAELTPYVRRPRVTLSILELRPLQIAIAGEVQRPGSYRLNAEAGGQGTQVPTLTEVIELAGGITQSADIRQIEVQRRLPALRDESPVNSQLYNERLATIPLLANVDNEDVTSDESDYKTIPVNLWDLLQKGDLDEDLLLNDGDRIIIPTARILTASEATELATASFSPDEMVVNVVGEVDDPGIVRVPPNTPLNQALLAAGGFNNRARRRTVNLIRLNPNGTVSERKIEVDFAQEADEELNPPLRPNDTIVVRRSILATVGDTVSQVASPILSLRGILRIFGL